MREREDCSHIRICGHILQGGGEPGNLPAPFLSRVSRDVGVDEDQPEIAMYACMPAGICQLWKSRAQMPQHLTIVAPIFVVAHEREHKHTFGHRRCEHLIKFSPLFRRGTMRYHVSQVYQQIEIFCKQIAEKLLAFCRVLFAAQQRPFESGGALRVANDGDGILLRLPHCCSRLAFRGCWHSHHRFRAWRCIRFSLATTLIVPGR